MFNAEELSAKLNKDKTILTVNIPAKDSNRATVENFKILADFINQTPDCQELCFLCEFEMSLESWSALGQCLSTTQLIVLDLKNNRLGKMPEEILPHWRIRALMQALQKNRTLYRLDARDCGLDRICVTHIKEDIAQRPLWISVLMTQNHLKPPTCSFVDEGVDDNREMAVQLAISIAQVAVTTHPVSEENNTIRNHMRTLCMSSIDVISCLNQTIFFSKRNHPLNRQIARYFPKAYALAKSHPQSPDIQKNAPAIPDSNGCVIC